MTDVKIFERGIKKAKKQEGVVTDVNHKSLKLLNITMQKKL